MRKIYMHTSTHLYKYTSKQVHRCKSKLVHKTSKKNSLMNNYTHIQVYKFRSTQVYKYTSSKARKYTSIQVQKYTSTQGSSFPIYPHLLIIYKFHKTTTVGATAVGITAVRNILEFLTIINIGSSIILWLTLFLSLHYAGHHGCSLITLDENLCTPLSFLLFLSSP